ncbi:MAG TPA: diguanylate cyclase [Vicinamibacterales bacterium]|nr:diguanylate cyclase [Vicinamibacterales bacterium]
MVVLRRPGLPAAIATAAIVLLLALTIATGPIDRTGRVALAIAWAITLVVAALLLWTAWRARAERPERREAAPAAPEEPAAERPAALSAEALLRFAQELYAALPDSRLRPTIGRRLPALLGVRDFWIVVRFGDRQQIVLADTGARQPEALAAGPRHWITYPLAVDGETIGMLGVDTTGAAAAVQDPRAMQAVTAILGPALKTAYTLEFLRETSIVDPLTGCSTRPHALQRLAAELNRAQRSNRPLALLLLDLDHFKAVNDRYGHTCGDMVLSAVGRVIMQTLRASDVRCRWGGEEFLVVLPETSLEAATVVAESLRRRIADLRVDYGEASVGITASIGITPVRPGETNVQALIARVDAALYRAKSAGRNCIRVVIGDLRGAPVAWSPPSSPPATLLNFPDRRDPRRPDRRRVPSPGRRRTDPSPEASAAGD